MSKIEKIDQELKELNHKLSNVEGTPTEIYARIVGYYRSVVNWNKGKKEEYKSRKNFDKDFNLPEIEVTNELQTPKEMKRESSKEVVAPIKNGYLYFYRPTCPNCTPVKNYLQKLQETVMEFNVDTAEGFDLASQFDIMSTPTAIYINEEGKELFRGNDVCVLKESIVIAC